MGCRNRNSLIYSVEGTRIIEKDQSNPLVFHISLTGGKVTFASDNTTYTRDTENRTRTWTEGYESLFNIWDDVYEIIGSASGTNRKGEKYTHTITTPLKIKLNCANIVSGELEMKIGDKTATINYGDGTCDRQATVTTEKGKTYNITLRNGL